MEDVPPSYESAINRDAWTIIAPWVPSEDLCSASLVSKKWHNIFTPFLWGDPASHFGTENDAVYVALTRFKRTLKRARLSVRQLTHTLHLPPALSEIYGGPNAFWLRDVLDHLPNLQSLLVSKLPFFDHQSLIALRQQAYKRQGTEETHSTYGLKLLLASKEPNATSVGLSEALLHFPSLVYLDLSYTTPSRDASVLLNLASLHDLQVLKLRGVGLRDGEAEILANAINTRARVLDIRDNHLTDMAVRSLMQACFLPPETLSLQNSNNGRLDDWPLGLPPGPDFLSLDSLRLESLEQQLQRTLTRPLTGRLAFEDIPHKGLTHLYISGNRLSVEGLSSLLSSQRLHVLDGGTVDTAKTITRTRSTSSPGTFRDEVLFPGAEKLVPILSDKAGQNLTYLRVNHAVVTVKLRTKNSYALSDLTRDSKTAELPSSHPAAELHNSARRLAELPAHETVAELAADPLKSAAELPGDIIHFSLTPAVGDPPNVDEDEPETRTRRGSGAFAPEPTSSDAMSQSSQSKVSERDLEDEPIILNATGTGLSAKRSTRPSDLSSSSFQRPSPQILTPTSSRSWGHSPSIRQSLIQSLLQKRPYQPPSTPTLSQQDTAILQSPSINGPSQLHPSFLPHLQTLVLTDVPTHVPASSQILTSLISFISACADESYLSHLLAQTNYSLPPGRSRRAAELRHAKTLFALETIVLEMAPPSSSSSSSPSSNTNSLHPPQQDLHHHHRHRHQRTPSFSKSSTGDLDSENLWTAAANDFSFFSDQGEMEDECGIYRSDVGKYDLLGRGDAEGMIAVSSDTASDEEPQNRDHHHRESESGLHPPPPSNPTQQPSPPQPQPHPSPSNPTAPIDVISALSTFRRTKRLEYERAVQLASSSSTSPKARFSPPVPPGVDVDGAASASSSAPLPPFVDGFWAGDVRVVRASGYGTGVSSAAAGTGMAGGMGSSWRR